MSRFLPNQPESILSGDRTAAMAPAPVGDHRGAPAHRTGLRLACSVAAAAALLVGCSSSAEQSSTATSPTEQITDITLESTTTTASTVPAPDPRSMTIGRLRAGTLVVPFDPASDRGSTVLSGGVWEGEVGDGGQGRIEMELDEQAPRGPEFADLNDDGVIEAIVAIGRQSVPSGRTVVGVVVDDALVDFIFVDYTGPASDIPIRSGLRGMRLVDGQIELTVTPNFVLDDPRLETQRWVLRGNELQRVG